MTSTKAGATYNAIDPNLVIGVFATWSFADQISDEFSMKMGAIGGSCLGPSGRVSNCKRISSTLHSSLIFYSSVFRKEKFPDNILMVHI